MHFELMNSFEADIIKAYTAVCRGYQLQGQPVLQAFAEALSVMDFLGFNKGAVAHSASQVFSGFVKRYSPHFPLNKEKRMLGIRHLRAIICIDRSCRSDAEKERAYKQICNHWFNVNAIQGEGSILWLHDELLINLPKEILLLCDLFRCRPKDVLHYFIEEVVLQMEQYATDGPALQFLLYCVSQLYDVKNN
jgi:hypothetical protein